MASNKHKELQVLLIIKQLTVLHEKTCFRHHFMNMICHMKHVLSKNSTGKQQYPNIYHHQKQKHAFLMCPVILEQTPLTPQWCRIETSGDSTINKFTDETKFHLNSSGIQCL